MLYGIEKIPKVEKVSANSVKWPAGGRVFLGGVLTDFLVDSVLDTGTTGIGGLDTGLTLSYNI